MKQITLYRIR